MIGDNKALKSEMERLVDDVRAAYEASGKRVSGEFGRGLKVTYANNGASLYGFAYLAGRKAGKMPPIDKIRQWVESKGITGNRSNMTSTSLAWAIAKKIAAEGTLKSNHLAIYDQVITPARIQSIIDRVSALNVEDFIKSVNIEFQKLTTNI